MLGHAWGNWWFGPRWPIGLIAIAAVVWLVTRDRRADGGHAPIPAPYTPSGYVGAAYVGSPGSGTSTGNVTTGETGGAAPPPPPTRPAWSPPPYVAPAPRPRRKGIVLFWPTLALVAIALGVLGLFAYNGTDVADAAYPALALAIIGAMLVVGAFVGRPGGLIFIGIISALAMAAASATGSFDSSKALAATHRPVAARCARPTRSRTPSFSLDLSPGSRTVVARRPDGHGHGGAGRIEVVVPRDLNVVVDSEIRVVGGYQIGDASGGGVGADHQPHPRGAPGRRRPSHLDLEPAGRRDRREAPQ